MRKPTFCTDVTVAEMTSANQNIEVCGESRMERVRKLLGSPHARRKSGTLALRIFGAPLDSLSQHGSVPFVVVRLCQYIEKTGMGQEGLFRVSGNARLVEKLRWSFDQSGDAPLEAEGDVAVAAALLKLLFRELPEPLVPTDMHQAFLDAIQATVHDREECTRRLKCLVEQLPPSNFAVLKYLCHFLSRVAELEEHTRMNPSALGIVFGPNLFRFSEDLQGLKEQAVTNQVVTYFIDHYNSIFEGDAELSCTADASMNIQGGSTGTSSKCSGRMMQPLTVVIPPLDEAMLALKQDTLSAVPTLMIDSLIDDRCNQAITYRAAKEGSSSGAAIPGRSCKRKERRISGEDTPAPRSSSEERPATGLRVEPELASRRCSSHEEVTTLETMHGYFPQMASGSSGRAGAPGDDSNRDLSPHPPQPKRREIETPSSPCPESSQEWREACRNVERPSPLHLQDGRYQGTRPEAAEEDSADRPMVDIDEPCHPPCDGREANGSPEEADGSVPNTPSTLSKDSIPPLDLNSFREEEPVLSEHRFSWPMVQALVDEEPVMPYLQKANSYEAPLSPSAYRSYLSHRSLHLDPNLPPSPPVEQDEFLKSNFKDEEASQTTVKQLSKRVHWLKKKVKQFEENFEKEHGYRPSHAEKMNHAEMKRTLLELNKLRKDLKNAKEENSLPEPAYLTFSSWGRDSLRGLCDMDNGSAKPTQMMEKALSDTLMCLAEKRRVAQRPDCVDDMTREQVLEEKLALQKALLRFESVHGRPSRRADRNLMRPLYDRYRSVKRLVGRNPLAKGKDSELQPILEHVAMNFTSPQPRSPPQELEEVVDDVTPVSAMAQSEAMSDMEEPVTSKKEVVEQMPMMLDKCSDSNLHELPLAELLQQQQQTKLEKRRLRKLLREFEEEFQKQTGRKVQKEDKAPMDSVYCEYKHVKARMRLLEVLVSKHEHRREI
ncbi:protein FAM13B isoform X1 [Dermacentor variabilis]|uniref:protein FAM13B isoform X1 n=1 Tax=Dermacentor variabilis TaxID=34621 RepID=UPI003F5B1C81